MAAKQYGGRWEIVRQYKEGGQSHIFSVKDLKGNEKDEFLLKRLKNKERIKRFEREIYAIQSLKHPNIAPIIDSSLDPPYYVTKFYRGLTLSEKALFPALEALEIFKQIVDAIAFAHDKKVIHRDLKPENIVFDENGRPIILDFGLCYFLEDDSNRITARSEPVGSRYYMAPELEGGQASEITPAIDIYALGKILYFILSKKHIIRENFQGANSLEELCHDQQLAYITERIIKRSVIENPDSRLSASQLSIETQEIKQLIFEHYYPGLVGSKCRYCGEGTYEEYPTIKIRLRTASVEEDGTFKIIVCNICRNMQWFLTSRI
jgi:serine/threonine protein kinase